MNLVQEDLVGTWEVALPGGIHVIQFEHGTTTGKRVIHVDGIEVRVFVRVCTLRTNDFREALQLKSERYWSNAGIPRADLVINSE